MHVMKLGIFIELGDDASMEQSYKSMVQQFPDNVAFRQALVRHFVRTDNIVQAEQLLQKDPDRKEFVSPAHGVIQEVGRVKIRITYSESQMTKSLSKKRGCEYLPVGYVPTVGDTVEVYFEKVVNRWTGRTNDVISKIIKQ